MRPSVVIPCYDHPRTVETVARGALEHGCPVFVVDDGSGAATRDALARVEGIRLLRHDRNRGKGAALRTAFEAAQAAGCTHAVTIDADGQHPNREIVRLLDASREDERALVLGARDLVAAGAGTGSRLGRSHSNFWTWVETGHWFPDTQTGLRSYPLAAVAELELTTTGYDFEIEVLVKAAWTGVPVVSVPVAVHYPPRAERVSHLRPFLDFLRIGRLNTRLVFLRVCLPAPFLATLAMRRFHAMPLGRRLRESLAELLVREPGSTRRIALSAGLGFFMGLAPIWGFQIASTLLAAHLLRLSKSVAVIASHISIPVLVPAIVYVSLLLGRWVLGIRAGDRSSLELTPGDAPAWIVGSLLLASITAVVGSLLVYVAVAAARRLRRSAEA